jgi:hypothetical protein
VASVNNLTPTLSRWEREIIWKKDYNGALLGGVLLKKRCASRTFQFERARETGYGFPTRIIFF